MIICALLVNFLSFTLGVKSLRKVAQSVYSPSDVIISSTLPGTALPSLLFEQRMNSAIMCPQSLFLGLLCFHSADSLFLEPVRLDCSKWATQLVRSSPHWASQTPLQRQGVPWNTRKRVLLMDLEFMQMCQELGTRRSGRSRQRLKEVVTPRSTHCFLRGAEASQSDTTPCICLCFCYLCFGGTMQKIISYSNVLFPCFLLWFCSFRCYIWVFDTF